jgi:MFS family permease
MWAVAVAAYFMACFQRSTLSVSGLAATKRFGLQPSELATIGVVQLVVYAGMQMPVGAVLNRFGARRLLLTGALTMAASQLLFALAPDYPAALVARVLLGGGDAMTFISVLRVVAQRFPARLNPLLVQLTGLVGQLGGVAAAIPLLRALHALGWTPAFLSAAALSLAAACGVALIVREPAGSHSAEALGDVVRDARKGLRAAWSSYGTRLGLWTHFTTGFSSTAFVLLWGFPFLVEGEHRSSTTAGALITVLTFASIALAPVIGQLTARFQAHRSWLVLGVVVSSATAWTVVLLWPGPAPLPVLVALVLVVGANGPGSLIGFDYARTFNEPERRSSAAGIVNVGAFVAAVLTILAVGIILGLAGPGHGHPPDLHAFRLAWMAQYPIWAIGTYQVVRNRARCRQAFPALAPKSRRGARTAVS